MYVGLWHELMVNWMINSVVSAGEDVWMAYDLSEEKLLVHFIYGLYEPSDRVGGSDMWRVL